jgi:hypothetical protein
MNLEQFLENYMVGKHADHTHTSMNGKIGDRIGGKWFIPENKMEEFYDIYSRETRELYITEAHPNIFGSICIDLDFRFKNKTKINNDMIKNIVNHLTTIFKDIFGEDILDKFMCVVLQRPKQYKKNELWCDGLHIIFPRLSCEYTIQFAARQKFIDTYDLKINCENKLENIYDKYAIKSTNWCMYGSTKPGKIPYDIVAIFNNNLKKDHLSKLQWIKLLSVRNGYNNLTQPTKLESIQKYLTSDVDKIKKNRIIFLEPTNDYKCDEVTVRKLLNILNGSRVESYPEWIRIGIILFHCAHHNNGDYLKIWDEWSQNSKKYEFNKCEKYWNNFIIKSKPKPLTIKSLYYYAECDNPDEYKKLFVLKS